MYQTAIAATEKKRKLEFFQELDKLDEASDTEETPTHHTIPTASKTARERPASAPQPSSTSILVPQSPDCMFVGARARPKLLSSNSINSPIVKATPYAQLTRNVASDIKEQMENSPSNRPGTRDAGAVAKRKKATRSSSLREVPESQKIFKGLVFFFVPNNNVSPARRMRISKALEFGATWAKTWQDQITHVIVDRELCFEDVMSYLKLKSFPTTMALVNDSYTADCIKFRSTVDVSHSRFQVRGAQSSLESTGIMSSSASLPLKLPRRNTSPAIATPPRIEQEPISLDEGVPSHQIVGEGESANSKPGQVHNDLLEKLIEEVKVAEVLPLDSEDDEPEATSSGSEDEGPKKKRVRTTAERGANPAWQQAFTCMQRHDGNLAKNNPNARTISILEQMLEHYERTSDQWRTITYRKAISALRRQKEKVVSRDQALRIPSIGERLASKIEEIVWTNRLRRLEYANLEPNDKILQMFLNIYGAGFAQASKWIAQGHRSLDDLKMKAQLTRNQQLGIEHYDDFLQRIPREEVKAHGDVVREAILKADPGVHTIIGGSYRRGASNSGDIDMLITKPGSSLEDIRSLMMDTVVPELFRQKFLKASLAISSRSDGSKWHGASALPGNPVWRRIDLLFVPWDEIGAALIYFTGNDIFNRSLRLLASKKGMCLNQRGLFEDVLRGPNRVKMNAGRLLEGHDEKRIFELLGVPWRPPEHRIC
ncbi:hypothetical protein FQN54_001401 [Arachnomyces sp. PD_36]|nr:hypothetical protein FQN54_001401 [Arachnomyces sp. PD_36]